LIRGIRFANERERQIDRSDIAKKIKNTFPFSIFQKKFFGRNFFFFLAEIFLGRNLIVGTGRETSWRDAGKAQGLAAGKEEKEN